MDTIKAILTRRSIRKFTSKPISKELLDEIVKCAMFAPSACNQQPWHFIIITDKDILAKIAKVHPYAQMTKDAAAAILTLAEKREDETNNYFVQDCSAATQNILLAAHEKEVGSVWIGIYPDKDRIKEMQALFKLPKDIYPITLAVLGYSEEKPKAPNRFNKEKVHYNRW